MPMNKDAWQKLKPSDMDPDEWEALRERSFTESIPTIMLFVWSAILFFSGGVVAVLIKPYQELVADCIRNIF